MKKFNKILALALAVVLVLALSATVLAVDPATDRTTETDGSVTVSNPKAGQTYTLYLLFKADVGANDAITYTANGIDLTNNEWFELNSNGFVVAKSGVSDDWAKDPDAIAWAKSVGTQVEQPITAGTDVKWENLEYGYYFVDTTLGAFIGVDSANKDAQIQEKNSEPGVDKEITGVENSDETIDSNNENAIAQIGDTVSYQLTVSAKPGAENYVVTDTLSAGLTPPAAADVSVSSGNGTYTVDVTGQVITVTFTKAYLDSITADTDIVISYDAVLNDSAIVGETGNENTVKLTWGDDPTVNYQEDETKVYSAQISLTKLDGSGNGLEGATFALKNSDGKYYAIDSNNVVTWVDSVDDATTYSSGSDGSFASAFTGLSNGEYVLEEVVVPEGYNAIAPDDASLKITIADKDYTDANLSQHTDVTNNAGNELPSTGGIGTTIFYVLGGILAVGAAVLLIAKKRMGAQA